MIKRYQKIPIGKNKGKSGFCVVSHTTGKVLSCYLSREAAQKALQRYQMFKNIAQGRKKIKKQIKRVLKLKK